MRKRREIGGIECQRERGREKQERHNERRGALSEQCVVWWQLGSLSSADSRSTEQMEEELSLIMSLPHPKLGLFR
jgi:hypothetical protein